MTENERKDYVCDLLDNLKEGVRWMDSIETIFNAVGITCKAIEPDPLLGFNLYLLFCHLQYKDLVAWWLNARDDEILYVDPRTGEEFEVLDAEDLYDLDQMKRQNRR